MNDEHPVLAAEHDDLPALTLIFPSGLSGGQVLVGLARAISEVRAGLAMRGRQFQLLERGYADRGNQFGTALCRGQALGCERAATAIDEAIIEVFGLWDQYASQVPGGAGDSATYPVPVELALPATVSAISRLPLTASRGCNQLRAAGRDGCARRRGRDGS